MRITIILGVLLFLLGFTIKVESETWASFQIPASATGSTTPVFTVDEARNKTYYSTGNELSWLGVALVGIAFLNVRTKRD